MKVYYGVIYFKDGRVEKTGNCSNYLSAERLAAQIYTQRMNNAIKEYFEPSRYEVKEEER